MKSEAVFKSEWCASYRKTHPMEDVMNIESEETVPGFPDTLSISRVGHGAILFEFKVSDAKGRITFQKSQPKFYKMHPGLPIHVVALDNRTGKTHIFSAYRILDKNDEYSINEKLEVQL